MSRSKEFVENLEDELDSLLQTATERGEVIQIRIRTVKPILYGNDPGEVITRSVEFEFDTQEKTLSSEIDYDYDEPDIDFGGC